MGKLVNKPHEIGQSNRIEKLENDLKQQKNRIDTLTNRIDGLDKEFKKYKKSKIQR